MPLDQPLSATEQFGQDVGRMTFGEHIEELRRRLIYALVGIVVALLGTFWFAFDLIGWIVQPFIQALDLMGFPPQTYVRDPTLGFGIYMRVSLVSAVVVASPWVIYQVWLFIVEGLYEHERRAVHVLAPFSTVMTVLAVLFTRYVLLPASMLFFVRFATLYPEVVPGEPEPIIAMLAPERPVAAEEVPEGEAAPPLRLPVLSADPAAPEQGSLWINGPEEKLKAFFDGEMHVLSLTSPRVVAMIPELGDYIRFATLVGLGNVVAFQLPVAMLIAGWTGLIPPDDVARVRKYAFFGCAVLSAVITPADIVSMLVLLLPLYGLFEFGLLLMRWGYREPAMSDGDGGGEE